MATSAEFNTTTKTGAFAELVGKHGRVLYTGTGFPHLFERTEPSGEHHFDRTWLYMPSHYLQMIRDQATGGGARNGLIWADPILCDDQPVFPLVYKGEVVAALSSDTSRLPEFSAADLSFILSWCEEEVSDSVEQVRMQSATFIRELFQRDSSPQQFMKRALGLLTIGWSRSCAGVYAEYQGTYQLRMATGDMSRWFRLTRQIHPEMAMRCLEAMYRHEYLIPADTTGDYPSFLDVMPDYLFIYEGLLSSRSKQFMLVTGPGTLTRAAARRLCEFARLISGLQEYQFASGAELLEDFSGLARQGIGHQSFDQMLTDLWGWLSQQISLSRLAVIQRQGKDGWEPATVIQRQQDGDSQLEQVVIEVPEHIIARLSAGESYDVHDIRSGDLSETLAKERYVRHVLSETYLPVQSPSGVDGLLLVGAPAAGDHLEQEKDLLGSVAGYISLWLQLDRAEKQLWSDADITQISGLTRTDRV